MCGFRELFDDMIYIPSNSIPDCPVLSEIKEIVLGEKIYSFFFMVVFIAAILYKLKQKGREYFKKLENDSIFILLDDYYNLTYVQPQESIAYEQNLEEIYQKNDYDILYFPRISTPIYKFFKKYLLPIEKCFWRNSKFLLYYLVVFGFVFISPIEYIFSFLISPCLDLALGLWIYGFIDVITSSCSIFVIVFMISFISSRRELQSLHLNDIKAKASLFHYHIKKAMIFGMLILILKVLLISISNHTFFDISLDPVSNFFWLGRAILFLFLIRRSHSRKRIQINCNCEMLKEHSKFYQIQNFLFKNRINLDKVMSFETKKEEFLKELENNLKQFVEEKWGRFIMAIDILDGQKFKNVIIQKNLDSNYHPILALIFYFYFLSEIILTLLSIMTFSNNEEINNSCFINSSPIIGYICLDFIEIIVFPYLFYKTTRKNNLNI